LTLHFSLSISITIFSNTMPATNSPPRLIPQRGQVLKTILKIVFSCLICASHHSSSNSPNPNTSSSIFPAPLPSRRL
ncbi:hypothetical protein VIGAN_01185400, partial [Vigna angularis var. angularis]